MNETTSQSTLKPSPSVFPGSALMARLELMVESGAHAGARRHLGTDPVTIGGTPDADIVLFGDELAPRHAQIVAGHIWSTTVKIAALDDAVVLSDGRNVGVGQFANVGLPATIELGGARVTIASSFPNEKIRRLAPPLLFVAAAIIVLAITFSSASPYSRSALVRSSPPSAPIAVGSETLTLERLRERLASESLNSQIQLTASPGGQIVASGAVDAAGGERWRSFLRWYDLQRGSPQLINNVQRSAALPNLPGVRTVWFTAKPHFTTTDEQTLSAGDTTVSGWTVEAIEPNAIILSKDGRSSRMTF